MKKFCGVFLLIFASCLVQTEAFAQTEYQLIQVATAKPSPKLIIPNQPAIKNFITFYQGGGRISMELGLANSTLHKKMIRRIFSEEGVPEKLSAIKQTLWMGAADSEGLWLLSDKIAKKYDLRKTDLLDERLSFEKATRATAQHLKSLYNKYKNWELVLAAYYSDENEVDSAIKRAKVKDFWKIAKYLPENTKLFVPNVFATILIAENPTKYSFEDIDYLSPMEYESVRIPPSISLEMIAKFSEDSIENIRRLNPELISNVTPPEPYVIRVTMGKGKVLTEKMRKQ